MLLAVRPFSAFFKALLVSAIVVVPLMATAGKVGGGAILFKATAGDVSFSHDRHVKGAGLKCTTCHDALYITKAKSVPATMKDMRTGKSCGACHDGKKAFDLNQCGKCHKH